MGGTNFKYGLKSQGVPVLPGTGDGSVITGNVFFVDSGAGSDGNVGTDKDHPFATIDYAIGKCTANNGDVIFVMAGHSETSLTASITADVAGITIMGLGMGQDRPKVKGPNADETILVSAANVTIRNLIFQADAGTTQAATVKVGVQATDCTITGCRFELGQYDDNAIVVTQAGDRCTMENNQFYISANGPDTAIYLYGASGGDSLVGTVIRYNSFDGGSATNSWDEGVIYSSGVHTNCLIEDNNFLFMSGGVGGIEFTAAATGLIRDNFFGGGTLGQMLDPGSCYCMLNKEADAINENARTFPASDAS